MPTPEQLVITAPEVLTGLPGADVLSPGYVVLRGGQVAAVGEGAPPGAADVMLGEGYLAPGFVDLQVNGYYGVELQDARAEGWAHVIERLPETGTTAFVPTFVTAPVERLARALREAATFRQELPSGARVLGVPAATFRQEFPVGARVIGVHLEGPFLSPERRGAHNPAWLTDPTPAAVDELIDAGGDLLRLVTIAPERPGALAAIAQLVAAEILVSVGHTDATAAQVAAAADAGARMVTHLYNAQRPLGNYEPGVVGQALTDPRLTSGLIADLHHVNVPACLIALAAAPGRIALVTDAAACAGMPPGRYLLGGEPIELPPGAGQPPRRPGGGLAGSALRMDTAVANLAGAGVSLPDLVSAATSIPADLIGCPDLGRIAPGAAGDLVWLGPDLQARATWIGGRQVFGATAPVR